MLLQHNVALVALQLSSRRDRVRLLLLLDA